MEKMDMNNYFFKQIVQLEGAILKNKTENKKLNYNGIRQVNQLKKLYKCLTPAEKAGLEKYKEGLKHD